MTRLEVFQAIDRELNFAVENFPRMVSYHEGFAILLEEVDELWDEIKQKELSQAEVRKEAVQVACMAIRFLLDLIPSASSAPGGRGPSKRLPDVQ